MMGRWAGLSWLLLALAPLHLARAGAPEPEIGRLRAHVATLASPEYSGRRGEGGRKAAAYIEKAFRDLGLEPLFGGAYVQPIVEARSGRTLGQNVGAKLTGTDPHEWLIVSAHFDHLGVLQGFLFPGADDNASGVAMLLEVARCFAQAETRPRRGLMFVGFDLEEDGLFGSRYFVAHPPAPLETIKLFLTADMIGRSLGGVCRSRVYVMGTEHAPGLTPWVEEAGRGRDVGVGFLGSDLLVIDRSDYGPFRARRVPYLFFSTGENPRYHHPSDTADTIDYAQVEAISRIIHGVVMRAATADSVPQWSARPSYPIGEAAVIRDVLRTLLAHRDDLRIKPAIITLMTATERRLDGMIARGSMTASERVGVVRVAQVVLFSVL